MKSLLSVKNLSVAFVKEKKENQVLHDINFQLNENEILGVVGESGSGKSVTSLAVMQLLNPKISKVLEGEILYKDKDLLRASNAELREIRGNDISMIFQEPMSALNPSVKCGKQVLEIIQTHQNLSKKETKDLVLNLFEKVKLPIPERVFKAYPHEISGGQKQRVMIAMAIANKPKILIADEPTTALDVTVQKEIISLLKQLQKEEKLSIIFISHDLDLIAQISDRVNVMYKGKIVESNTVNNIFNNPKNNYTKALLQSKPKTSERLKRLPTIKDVLNDTVNLDIITEQERSDRLEDLYNKAPILEINNLVKNYYSNNGLFKKEQFTAVNNASLKVFKGETLGLVGESGCGKSTLSNAILMIDKPSEGEIIYKGKDITKFNKKELKTLRKEIQIIFQDPFASLNPKIKIGEAILEPITVHNIGSDKKERIKKVENLLEKVGLSSLDFNKYPHEFSGGQRQRIGIARAIAVEPKLIVCDESVSALDISVQAQVLNLLNDLKDNYNFSYIFISHDLSVVKYMSDKLIVMNKGQIEEYDDADKIYANPKTEYTRKLINSIPKGLK